jgi:hypothetical protein
MVTRQIGVRELQSQASRVVREAETGDVRFRVSVHGRDTRVEIGVENAEKASVRAGREGISATEFLASPLYQVPFEQSVAQQLIDLVEAGRDAAGTVATLAARLNCEVLTADQAWGTAKPIRQIR